MHQALMVWRYNAGTISEASGPCLSHLHAVGKYNAMTSRTIVETQCSHLKLPYFSAFYCTFALVHATIGRIVERK